MARKPSDKSYIKELGIYVPKVDAKKLKTALKAIKANEALPKKLRAAKKSLSKEYYIYKKYQAKIIPVDSSTYNTLDNSEKISLAKMLDKYPQLNNMSLYNKVRLTNSLKAITRYKKRKDFADVEQAMINMYMRKDSMLPKFFEMGSNGKEYKRVLSKTERELLSTKFKTWGIPDTDYRNLYGSD